MTNDIDWEAEMEALDASLPRRLMPATGMADLIWEAYSEILGWRALNALRQAEGTGGKDD